SCSAASIKSSTVTFVCIESVAIPFLSRCCNQLPLTLFHVSHKAAPTATRSRPYGRSYDQQTHGFVASDGVAVFDAARQKDEAPFFQVECLFTTSKRDRTLKNIEHLVFGI